MDQNIISKGEGYAVYPSVFMKNYVVDGKGVAHFKWVKQLLFGDWIGLLKDDDGNVITSVIDNVSYIKVRARGQEGYILPNQIQYNRVLEVNFVDVGQGDGCHIVTPDDEHFIIDAGDSDNMYRFLRWRFNLKSAKKNPPPFTVVISHSDKDHYYGFFKIFEDKENDRRFNIKKIYHNGMIETSGEDVSSLGTLIEYNGKEYITDLCDTQLDFLNRIPECKGYYGSLLKKVSAPKEALRKGSKPIYDLNGLVIDVLGPVAESVDGKDALPVFGKTGKKGKTKNGHSVVLKLTIGKFKMLLGGDLNMPSEDHLMKYYSGSDIGQIRKRLQSDDASVRESARLDMESVIEVARSVLQVDVAKSCHHGSSDFTTEFMRAVNPIATIISSGDEEPHVHPRPDTLGTIGKHSRGDRSLIFSTELARSAVEFLDLAKIKELQGGNQQLTKERVVTVYGMINVRSDGEKAIIAQKLEKKAPRGSWDIHKLEWAESLGEFVYAAKEKED